MEKIDRKSLYFTDEEYLLHQLIEYKKAMGETDKFRAHTLPDELIAFLKERQDMTREYVRQIESLGLVEPIGIESAEIGKGKFDRAFPESTLITPYTFGIEDKSKVVAGDFYVLYQRPITIRNNKINYLGFENVDRFATQNPYDFSRIEDWYKLHNNEINIALGVYGDCHDRDASEKIRKLKGIRDKMAPDTYEEKIGKIDDMYYYVVASNPEEQVKVRVRKRG